MASVTPDQTWPSTGGVRLLLRYRGGHPEAAEPDPPGVVSSLALRRDWLALETGEHERFAIPRDRVRRVWIAWEAHWWRGLTPAALPRRYLFVAFAYWEGQDDSVLRLRARPWRWWELARARKRLAAYVANPPPVPPPVPPAPE